mmetsp:Transcript_29574/g.62853  ORF Transcript_29574/g.62853 Transcript_29574/m.62853 type:complete len:83 (+) Transcript_29574:792-1040(+)
MVHLQAEFDSSTARQHCCGVMGCSPISKIESFNTTATLNKERPGDVKQFLASSGGRQSFFSPRGGRSSVSVSLEPSETKERP